MPESASPSYSVLVVDDDAFVREAFRAFFMHQNTFRQVGEARDGLEGIDAYSRLRPDVVLMDLQMPTMSGIDATAEITAHFPDACVVALTTFGGAEYVVPALRAGASGYLLKDSGAAAVMNGLRAAVNGEMPLSPSVRRELVGAVKNESRVRTPAPDIPVTQREQELLEWLAYGMTNAEIAAKMYVSEGSVKQYLGHIGDKLGVKSRTQILVRAIQLDLVDPHGIPDVSGPVE